MNAINQNVTERINLMYRYAVSKGLVKSKTEFAELLNVTQATMSRFLSGKNEPADFTLRKFNARMGHVFNETWLLVGKGEMLASKQSTDPITPQPQPSTPTEPVGCEAFSSAIHELIVEMRESRIAKDEQIDRLLTIIENMQKN